MPDEKAFEQAAREIVDQYGAEALPIIRQRAEAAEELDDELATKAWRDIAEAAERLLRQSEAGGAVPDPGELREKAQRCRDLLRSAVREDVKEQLLRWAADFDAEAEAAERAPEHNRSRGG